MSYLIQLIDLLKANYIWYSILLVIFSLIGYEIAKYELAFVFVFVGMTFLGYMLGYYPQWFLYFIVLAMITFSLISKPKFNGWRI